ncbi:MAG TPA: hypothetical protein VEA99_20990 [Gemmatimonadaceae bacterium]|nr:hypothetical protein [Gemmatimonadaceae bacterium]
MRLAISLALVFAPAVALAQVQPQSASAPLTTEQQIASAVLPIPAEFRASATVLGYAADRRLVTLRQGTGAFVCLASDPAQERFHVACYHRALEPFMARGRELRARGITQLEKVDSARFADVKAGRLRMPEQPAALYSLTGGRFDPATGVAEGARPLFVIYVPNATAESTGLSATPSASAPWLMFPGTPKAHIMFTPRM